MTGRKHVHSEELEATAEQLFQALITPSAICRWWSASQAIVIPRENGTWSAVWGDVPDSPDYVTSARLREFDPPRRLVMSNFQYAAKSGRLPFEAEFETSFMIEPLSVSTCRLTVCQSGFPSDPVADAHYEACRTGWQRTFAGLRRYLDAGER